MSVIHIIKGADCTVKFRCFTNFLDKIPIDLSQFKNIIFAVTERGNLLIEKQLKTNDITIDNNNTDLVPFVARVKLVSEDTLRLLPNSSKEPSERFYELFVVADDDSVQRIDYDNFYVEPSGYMYARRNRISSR